MPHRVLITGVSGFVGGFLAEHLLEAGCTVLGCSPDGAWEEDSSEALEDRVELLKWDLAQPRGMADEGRHRIERFAPSAIYHLAALSVPEDCGETQPSPRAVAINVDGTRRVLELAASLPSRPRVLFTSSSHVYAPVRPASPQVDEDAPLAPKQGYGRSKLAAEREVLRAVRRNACDAVIARSFQHTGPRQNARMMLPQWAEQFACGGSAPVEVYTCNAYIDLTDVRDVVEAYRLLIEHGRGGTIYNVGSGISRRTGDILNLLRAMADPGRPVIETRPGFKQDPIANVSRLVRAIGWRAAIPPEQTIADTLAWWRRRVAGSDRSENPNRKKRP